LFIHIGESKVLSLEEVIGIFDYRACARQPLAAQYIDGKRHRGLLIRFSEKRTKSYIVCRGGEVFLSPISSKTLEERFLSLAQALSGLDDEGDVTRAEERSKDE
jgi:regulator of extracellular matrix RemA (YlzA/DUF370 family)